MGIRIIGPRVFTVSYCTAYALVFLLDKPLFFYYPVPKRFAWGWEPLTGVGPGIVWYGLMASAVLIALFFSAVVPDKVIDRTVSNSVWVFPVAAMVISALLVRKFFGL